MRLSFSHDLSCFSLSFLNDLCLNEFSLGNDLVILKICLSINLVDNCVSFSSLLTSQSQNGCLQSLNLFLLVELSKIGLLFLVLSLFQMDLFDFLLLFFIVSDSLVESKPFSLEGSFELVDCGLLHGISDLIIKSHRCNHYSFDQDTLVGEVRVQEIEHTGGMSLTSKVVSILRFNSSSHGSNSLHNIGINEFVLLGYVCHELLNIIRIFDDFEKNGDTDSNVGIILSVYSIVWTLIHKILS